MHTWHQGCAKDLASVIIDMLDDGLLYTKEAATPDAALKALHIECRDFGKSYFSEAPVGKAFSLQSFGRDVCHKVFPVFGSSWKACSMKLLTFFLARKCHNVCNGTQKSKMRATCTWAIAEFLHILDVSDLVMTPSQVQRAQHAGFLFLQSWQWLAHDAM